MAERPNAQEHEENVKDTPATYTKSGNRRTSEQQATLTGEQEATMQDELGRILDESDQSESSNGKNSQRDGGQTESQEIHSGKAETDAVDNQHSHLPSESQQGQQEAVKPETTPYVLPQMPTEPNTVRSNDYQYFVSSL